MQRRFPESTMAKQFLLQFQFYKMSQIVDFSGIRTQILRIEGKHADHLTTTTTTAHSIENVWTLKRIIGLIPV